MSSYVTKLIAQIELLSKAAERMNCETMDIPSSMLTDAQKKVARSDFVLLFTTMYNQARATGRNPSKDTSLAELLSHARAQGIHDISRIGRGKLLINGKIFDY